mmetsp:Transcript_18296/g.22230  ORF Transcript_18296/g.22230 Transcript_18296/m.22230 type:complete len:470 (+) Transcript_18296:220-1629(+)
MDSTAEIARRNGRLRRSTSGTALQVFRKYMWSDKVLNVDQVFSRDCFLGWLRSRSSRPRRPYESFRRALTAHVRGSDGRRPFTKREEEALLIYLRKKGENPFDSIFPPGEVPHVGTVGFRGKGYHEKKETEMEPLIPLEAQTTTQGSKTIPNNAYSDDLARSLHPCSFVQIPVREGNVGEADNSRIQHDHYEEDPKSNLDEIEIDSTSDGFSSNNTDWEGKLFQSRLKKYFQDLRNSMVQHNMLKDSTEVSRSHCSNQKRLKYLPKDQTDAAESRYSWIEQVYGIYLDFFDATDLDSVLGYCKLQRQFWDLQIRTEVRCRVESGDEMTSEDFIAPPGNCLLDPELPYGTEILDAKLHILESDEYASKILEGNIVKHRRKAMSMQVSKAQSVLMVYFSWPRIKAMGLGDCVCFRQYIFTCRGRPIWVQCFLEKLPGGKYLSRIQDITPILRQRLQRDPTCAKDTFQIRYR